MNLTKDKLVKMCKELGLPTTGTKQKLHSKIADVFCGTSAAVVAKKSASAAPKKSATAATTFRGVIRAKNWELVKKVVADIVEMIEDDSDEAAIVRSLSKLHKVKLEKNDIIMFADMVDAAGKSDFGFIEERLDTWGAKAKYAKAMGLVYAKKEGLPELEELCET